MKKEAMCENPCCGEWHGYYKHAALRIVLALFVLGFVFHMGVKFGEFKAMFHSSYGFGGHRMMSGDRMLFLHDGYGGEMMQKKVMVAPAPAPETAAEEEEEAN